MLTLIQYEMKKTAFMKILCFSALLIAQAFVLLGGATDNFVVIGLGAGLLIFFSFLIFFILGLSSMASLSKDLNTTQGYMLFMLPKHSACFLLAKIIESLISTFLAGVLVFLLFSFNVVYFALDMEFYQDAFEMFWNLLMSGKGFGELSLYVIRFLSTAAAFWIFLSTIAILCVTIQASLFKGKALGLAVSIIAFLFLFLYLFSALPDLAYKISWKYSDQVFYGMIVILSIGFFALSSYLLEKKRNF